jgi:hypothetical protein
VRTDDVDRMAFWGKVWIIFFTVGIVFCCFADIMAIITGQKR